MAELSQKTILLLDKLYNLKGEDNIILQEIESKIEGTQNNIAEANAKQTDLEQEKTSEENELVVFSTQQEAFLTAFSEIDDETFAALRRIGVDVNIGSMISAVREKAPTYIEDLRKKIANVQAEIDADVLRKQQYQDELQQLYMAKDKADADRLALQSLMEQSLSSDETERESLPTKYVKDTINRFGIFDLAEISILTKLIMFPEDGLEEYDRGYAERLANGLVGEAEVIGSETAEEAKEEPIPDVRGPEVRVEEEKKPEPIVVVTGDEEEKAKGPAETTDLYNDNKTSIMDLTSLNTPSSAEEPKEESIDEFLSNLGLEMNLFQFENEGQNQELIMRELAATDKELMSENFELLSSMGVENAAYRYRNGHIYLADKDLSRKITLLRAKNISEKNIKLLLERDESGLRESYEVVLKRFEAAEELGTPIDNDHIDLLSKDVVKLADNIRLLSDSEISLDEKERRNFDYILTHSDYIAPDLEILKNYLINITRSNDKYALNVFNKSPYDLLTDIDKIIEYNLEDVLSTNPEVLTGRNGAFVERVRYYEGLGKPITDTTGKYAYAPYVLNPLEAIKENGGPLNIPMLPSEEEVNAALPTVIGNENISATLVNALNDYYLAREDFKEIDLDEAAKDSYAVLMKRFEETYHAESVGKYTWKVADHFISKAKLDRHLKVLLNAITQGGESINGVENEVLLTSMLYNHCFDQESLRKMVETCLGFNEENTYGGRAL